MARRVIESEWAGSTDLFALHLTALSPYGVTYSTWDLPPERQRVERKWRLFCVAACRRIWHLLEDARCRNIVSLSERIADDTDGTPHNWTHLTREVHQIAAGHLSESRKAGSPQARSSHEARGYAAGAVFGAGSYPSGNAYAVCIETSLAVKRWAQTQKYPPRVMAKKERRQLCHVLRDIFGNPFHSIKFDPRWGSETVVSLAKGIYADRAFDRMPILADALEEAGCDNAEVLTHCRGDGPHARGCWVVDLLLGKS